MILEVPSSVDISPVFLADSLFWYVFELSLSIFLLFLLF
jgi:hypothetical protein